MSIPIILDCDNTLGIPLKDVDDGLTLLYLLGVPEVRLEGICATFGNGTLEQVLRQTHFLIDQCNLSLPVLAGAREPHGEVDTPAARFLVEMANAYPGELIIIATGPLSNLLSASRLDPQFFRKVAHIHVMWGYLAPLKIGWRQLAELNLSADAGATAAVFSASCRVTLASAQACLDAPYTWRQINQAVWWRPTFRRILKRWLLAFGLYCGTTQFYLWDLLPAVYLTRPELFEIESFTPSTELACLRTGSLTPDNSSASRPITLIKGIKDRAGFFQELEQGWQRSAEWCGQRLKDTRTSSKNIIFPTEAE